MRIQNTIHLLALSAVLGLAGWVALPPALSAAPTPVTPAQPANDCKTKNGRVHSIVVTPCDNPATKRRGIEYRRAFILGYMNAWNSAVIDRKLLYRSYGGKWPSPTAEYNFHLYDGEEFDVDSAKVALGPNPAASSEVFALSDQRTSENLGRIYGEKAAKADFLRLLPPQEKH